MNYSPIIVHQQCRVDIKLNVVDFLRKSCIFFMGFTDYLKKNVGICSSILYFLKKPWRNLSNQNEVQHSTKSSLLDELKHEIQIMCVPLYVIGLKFKLCMTCFFKVRVNKF